MGDVTATGLGSNQSGDVKSLGDHVDLMRDNIMAEADSLKTNASDISAGDILIKSLNIDAAKDSATLAGNIAKSQQQVQTKSVQQASQ